jgi:hypothetical protein
LKLKFNGAELEEVAAGISVCCGYVITATDLTSSQFLGEGGDADRQAAERQGRTLEEFSLSCRTAVKFPVCIYMFCVDLRTNSDYFPIQH